MITLLHLGVLNMLCAVGVLSFKEQYSLIKKLGYFNLFPSNEDRWSQGPSKIEIKIDKMYPSDSVHDVLDLV